MLLLLCPRYIEENYSKIRDVERELSNLTFELKLTAGPKKAALELLRKKIEMSTERISVAKQKEEQARKVWEAASKAVKDEEAVKQKLCDDLSQLVQESSHTQFSRLEELKRRLEALNPSRASISGSHGQVNNLPEDVDLPPRSLCGATAPSNNTGQRDDRKMMLSQQTLCSCIFLKSASISLHIANAPIFHRRGTSLGETQLANSNQQEESILFDKITNIRKDAFLRPVKYPDLLGASCCGHDQHPEDGKLLPQPQSSTVPDASSAPLIVDPAGGAGENVANQGNGGNVPATNGHNQQPNVEGEGRGKKKSFIQGRGRGIGAVPKGRGSSAPGWTGAGFDVDGRT
ncbi:hypothetical protein CK203_105618 [Vitis vinifera]|uniref:RAB6-interacting golgin n=1 Tax=Vitis vinifera TaxID=29760 RepID=A0A438CUV4_VITVI|nr:hypothetical protein CK203_105618 [Vitis vinifera]